jgi:superoxide dismutase
MRPYRSSLPAIATNWGAGGPQSIDGVLGIGWKGARMTASPRSMPLGGRPILALDMYEHSYRIDFGATAAAYVDAFMAVISWSTAANIYGNASS